LSGNAELARAADKLFPALSENMPTDTAASGTNANPKREHR
jgi:hypothetical protein